MYNNPVPQKIKFLDMYNIPTYIKPCVVSFRIRYMALMMRFLTYMMVEKRIVITISEDIYMRYIS